MADNIKIKGRVKAQLISRATGDVVQETVAENAITDAFFSAQFMRVLSATVPLDKFTGITKATPNMGIAGSLTIPTMLGIYVMQNAANITGATTAAPYRASQAADQAVVLADFDDDTSNGVLWYCCGDGTKLSAVTAVAAGNAGTLAANAIFYAVSADFNAADLVTLQNNNPRLLIKNSSLTLGLTIDTDNKEYVVTNVWERDSGHGTIRSIVIGSSTNVPFRATARDGAICPQGYVISGVDFAVPLVKTDQEMVRITYSYHGTYDV